MDQMVVAFWVFSGLIIAANICIRLWSMEPAVKRPYTVLPPNLSDDKPNIVAEIADPADGQAAMGIN